MKKIPVGLLLFSSLCSFAKDKKDKPAPAFKKGGTTAFVAYGIPTSLWQKPKEGRDMSYGAYLAGAEYHLSRAFKVGVVYSYFETGSGMLTLKNRYTGTPFQLEGWQKGHGFLMNGEYCYLNRGKVSLAGGLGLGMSIHKSTGLTIDSAGNSRTNTFSNIFTVDFQLRLLDARIKLTDNFGLLGALNMGLGGRVVVGAHYTFTSKKK